MKIHTRQLAQLTATLLLLWSPLFAAAAIVIEFEGIDDELEATARANLDLAKYADREVTSSQVNRLFAAAPEQIAKALEPFGYYHARAQGDLQKGAQPGEYHATFKVELGPPVIVSEVRVDVGETAAALDPVKSALEAFRPAVGDRLQHGVYESSKSNIITALQTTGFFDAKLQRHRVEVVAAANSADIELAWNTGQRYRFGDVRFPPTQFDESFLQRYVPWKPDTYYSTDDLLIFQQRLVDADYFSSVSVQPVLDQMRDGHVPIETLLVPAKRTIYRAGAYISTDAGPGVRLGMERRWLNRLGHKIGGDIEYSQRLEEYSTFYRIPRPGEKNRNYNFAAGYRDEETDSSRSRTARIAASEIRENWNDFTRTLGLQYLNGDFEIADERNNSSLLFAEAMLTRKRIDNLIFPARGISLAYGLRLAPESPLSDTSFAQVRADAKWIRPASDKSRLILRGAVGAMVVDDFDALPPELRFFAGGDRSVRGFDYQQIGETNESGGVIGGEFLTVASIEYEYYFLPNWGGAIFVDAGDAYSSNFEANVGAGIGVRWKSPVGIVRLDVGMPVVTDLEESIRFHVVIGPDL